MRRRTGADGRELCGGRWFCWGMKVGWRVVLVLVYKGVYGVCILALCLLREYCLSL
jgi:hypothetical protein